MFGARSWIRRADISVVLLAALCGGLVTLPHAEGSDDPACAAVFVSHDESAHYIGAAPSTREIEGQHCYLCHSARSFSSFFDKYEQRYGALRAERLHATRVVLADRLEWSLILGRAPPA